MEDTPNNLPNLLSSFIGRERELTAIRRLLAEARLLTLTGVGGVGKSRLALQAARAAQGEFVDGVWLVEYAALANPLLVPQAAAAALGVREQQGRTPAQALCDYLRPRQALLLFDNCEYLILACAQLAETLLQACPGLRILATSLEALGVDGEMVYPVPTLPSPDPRRLPAGDAVAEFDAVRLFVERAAAAQPGFALTGENAPGVAQICARLDGMPLAIELAAARVRSLSVGQIVARLDERFTLLTGGNRTAPPRHQTLLAAIAWSHDLLTEPERILFRRLSVCAGGWSLEAAQRIAGDEVLGAPQVLHALMQLVNKSLVLAEGQNGGTRYGFLETIRQYARERLQASGETEGLQDRHLGYFLGLAEEAVPRLLGPEQLHWLDYLEREHDNLRAALQRARERGQTALGVRLAVALSEFWPPRGHVAEGRAWFDSFLSQPAATERSATRASALWGAGRLGEYLGDSAVAQAQLDESIAIWREAGDEHGLAKALRDLGYSLMWKRNDAAAQPLLEESARLFRKMGDKFGLAYALRFLGNMPDAAYATRCLEESLSLFRELTYATGIGAALLGLGIVAVEQREFDRAKAYFKESLAVRAGVHEEYGVALASGALGDVAILQGEFEQATSYYEKALEIHDRLAGRLFVAGSLNGLALVAVLKGENALALPLLRRSLNAYRDLAHPPGLMEGLVGFASCAASAGQPESAPRLFGALNALLDRMGLRLRPVHRVVRDRYLNIARTQVDSTTFAKAWDEGRGMTLEQAVAEALQVAVREPSTPPPPARPLYPADLTAREFEVLRLLAQGLTDAEIAATLVISPRTVNSHLRSIYGKLDVTNRTAAARYAAEFKRP